MKNLIYMLLFVFLSGCFEKDKKVPPYPREVTTIENNIGEYQSYFDLESNRVVSFNPINEWDLGFDCRPKGWHIKINSAKGLFLTDPGLSSIEDEISLTGTENWKYDSPTGNADSSAFGIWCDTIVYPCYSKSDIFILGEQKLSGISPVIKIQMLRVDSGKYFFSYRRIDDSDTHEVEITKIDSTHFVYFSFTENTQKSIEPNLNSYDILFTPYYDLLFDTDGTPVLYLVRGVFLNPGQVSASLVTTKQFDEIVFEDMQQRNFTYQQNFIGYNWKEADIDFTNGTATYLIVPNRVYLIKSVEGNYFKLQFVSYTLNGVHGYPRFNYKLVTSIE